MLFLHVHIGIKVLHNIFFSFKLILFILLVIFGILGCWLFFWLGVAILFVLKVLWLLVLEVHELLADLFGLGVLRLGFSG